ncbi:DUF4164 family protein [Caulobacter sp. 17J80-11]|uniref:DUF4164 family protein n=1 Tax=Caulobacter sp. 17J80-11 TaxID=2763502 RepID=UPI0016538C91|nr:DUF4164 family protein [Caulobacter sp. 17J80-11]MBC6980285.1 DUF4164 family protein [Caulobacter sp. 17J80-11]
MADSTSELDAAAGRLDQALTALEGRFRALKAQSRGGEGDLFDQDRARLAEDLDRARARARDLEDAAAEASAALGRAAEHVRLILTAEE